ncbi:MAG: hypothetical protein NUV82_01200, partial [Candidatus Komeilibacteria bacterium]|nr:hypothetical protein [Candidatus Komeilibacteria bacterium]
TLRDNFAFGTFDWQRATQNKFPRGCFQCSCGERWWNIYEQHWMKVTDLNLWKELLRYNGKNISAIAIVDDSVYLAKTAVNQGLKDFSIC